MSEARLFEANIHFDNKMSKIEKTFYIKKKKKTNKQTKTKTKVIFNLFGVLAGFY